MPNYDRWRRGVNLTNADGLILDIDPESNSLINVNNEHHHIHEGLAWSITDTATLNGGANKDYLIITPDSGWRVHLRPEVTGEAEGSLTIWEDVTTSNNGTALTKVDYSLNRDDQQAGYAAVYVDPTVTNTGSRRRYFAFGAGQSGGGVDAAHEIVLKRNTVYLVRITSDAAGNECAWNIFWYEHLRGETHPA